VAEAGVMDKILIVAPNWIGDAILSLPVIEASGRLWPNSEITVMARTGIAEIFAARGPTLGVLEYQRGDGIQRLAQLLKLGRGLRRHHFSLALLLPNSLSSALVVWLAGIPARVGYATDGRGWLLTHPLKSRRRQRGLHQADYYTHLLHSLGATRIIRTPRLHLSSQITNRSRELLSELGVDRSELLVGVHPGASYGEAKRWFPERFAAVLERLGKPGRRFILLGGPGEEPLAEEISLKMRHPSINLVGRTTVVEAMGLISQCNLFLSNDSGLMHVAAALGIPQVALFGSTDPQKTAPLNERAVVIHPKEIDCSPCFKPSCPSDLECMKAIGVDEVCAAAERLLRD
jgi:heptosyltransferase-2